MSGGVSVADSGEAVEVAPRSRALGRVALLFRRSRMLWMAAAVASVALVVGLVAGRALGPAAVETAQAGILTAPVGWGELRNELIVRGDVGFADAVEVTVDTATMSAPPVVTGRVPEVGAELAALSVALEVAGRPVIVLPGEVPPYRRLEVGSAGPDVVQLKTALRAVGLDGGDPASDRYDEATAAAVAEMYARAGYPVPEGEESGEEAVRLAGEGVTAAEQAAALARIDLQAASAGPTPAELLAADNAIASAQRELEAARSATPDDGLLLAGLEDAVSLARAQRDELAAPPAVAAPRLAVEAADASLAAAREALARATREALPALPAAEVIFLAELPRQVDAVTAVRGSTLAGPAMTVSGATLALSGSITESDARLLAPGAEAFFALPDGTEHRATVEQVAPGPEGAGWLASFAIDPLEPTVEEQLRGQNVRVRIPVGATDGEVLSVPAAALTSGPGGETRVEVVDGDPRSGEQATRRMVVVETGLATPDGVEVNAIDASLGEGDLVVVGR